MRGQVRQRRLGLAALVDLEAQVAADRTQPSALLQERDGRIGRSLVGRERQERALAIGAWLEAVTAGRSTGPGRRLEVALDGLGWLAAGLGVVLGVSAALVAFHTGGSRPVNILHALAVLLLPQWLLLLAMAGGALLRAVGLGRGSAGARAFGALHAWSLARVARMAGMAEDADLSRATSGAAASAVSARAFAALQSCAVTFNLAALATCLALVTGSDLAFAWTTTLAVDARAVHELVAWVAAPFAWIDPALVPTLDAVAASRYLPLEGRFEGAWPRVGDAEAVRTWWPFLAACIGVYGLLPRVVLYVWSRLTAYGRVRRVRLDSLAVEEICTRLGFNGSVFRADPIPQDELAAAAERDKAPLSPLQSVSKLVLHDAPVVAVIWRDAVSDEAAARSWAAATTGGQVKDVVRAGGDAFDLEGKAAAFALRQAKAHGLVFVDAWESLQKALARFLGGLADGVSTQTRILIVPVGGEPPTHWSQQLAAMGRPQLGLAAAMTPSELPVEHVKEPR